MRRSFSRQLHTSLSSVPLTTGVAVGVTNGVASIYVTGATSSSTTTNTVLYKITDSSRAAGKLTGSATAIVTAPTGFAFKGLVLLPPGAVVATPETPYLIALPALRVVLFGGASVAAVRRRYRVA
jgi:hypothetical protein